MPFEASQFLKIRYEKNLYLYLTIKFKPMKKIYFYFLFCLICGRALSQVPTVNSISGSATVCTFPSAGHSYTAHASNNPTYYNWFVSPSNGVVISNPTSSVTTIDFPYGIVYTVYCTASNPFGTSNPKSQYIYSHETPEVTFSGATRFCQGSSTNISASPTSISASPTITYSWTPSTGLSNTSGQHVNAQPPVTTTYTVLLTNGPCTNMDTVTITVDICLGIKTNELNTTDLSAYPNPNNGDFIIKGKTNELVSIANELGQIIQTVAIVPDAEIKITGLPPGIYFVFTLDSRKKIIVTKDK